jgi:RHS repeat-associated protein
MNVTSPDPALRIRYFHPDHLGSSSVMTDQNGALVEETTYYPFGLVRNAYQPRDVSEPYQFTQKERDPESGLHYFGARYLTGSSGRFISVDPLYAEPLQLGDEKFNHLLSNPQDFNLYSYARNNPLIFTDPSGYEPKPIEGGGSLGHNSVLPYTTVLPSTTVLPCRRAHISGHAAILAMDEVERAPGGGYRPVWAVAERGSKAGDYVVPNDTTVTVYAPHGFAISEELGEAIEQRRLRPEQFKVTYYPGDRMPNYVIFPPTRGMRTHHPTGVNTITVSEPTALSTIIKPGMGAVHMATCVEDYYPPWKTTTNEMGLLKPGQDPSTGGWTGWSEKRK